MVKLLLLALLLAAALRALAQPAPVPKTNSMPVYAHYMCWFDTRQTTPNGAWGLHWTMANRNPDVVADPATGRRQIAAHYYPLIGPYASNDRDVLEYHLLLMKYAGIDGVLVDFYGNGANDLPLILRNTNALADYIGQTGLKLGMVFEDQFAATLVQARANMRYLDSAYAARPDYIRHGGKPLVMAFGPQRYQAAADWTQILSALSTDPEFLTLWYESADAGANADGEFAWIHSDYLTGLRNFYTNRAPGLGTVAGVAYPGFHGFYAQGGWAGPTWAIPLNDGHTLDATLALATQHSDRMDVLQLATWNDFGEGTMLEPTLEFGFTFLEKVQAFTGVAYTAGELRLIHGLYLLRKRYAGAARVQAALERASGLLAGVQVPAARHIIDSLNGLAGTPSYMHRQGSLALCPNPAADRLRLSIPAGMEGGTVSVHDALGRCVWAAAAAAELDVSGLKPGLYRLELASGQQRMEQRFTRR